jgi:hypothetical protein
MVSKTIKELDWQDGDVKLDWQDGDMKLDWQDGDVKIFLNRGEIITAKLYDSEDRESLKQFLNSGRIFIQFGEAIINKARIKYILFRNDNKKDFIIRRIA